MNRSITELLVILLNSCNEEIKIYSNASMHGKHLSMNSLLV